MRTVLIDLRDLDESGLAALAELSFHAARAPNPGWLPTLEDAREEVRDALEEGKHGRVLVIDGRPVAWVSIMPMWGRVWELHPLLVAVDHHGRGYGRRLVAEAERLAAELGALTLWVGTSDEIGATSLANCDLYQDPISALAGLEIHTPHAVGFWLRLGYRLVGVVPDAEGPGKPSISLAKRVNRS